MNNSRYRFAALCLKSLPGFSLMLIWFLASGGLCSVPTSGAAEVMLEAGSVWKYLDTGVNDGPAWRGLGFDDSMWPSGRAPLGYDLDSNPATVIGFGPDEFDKHITAWFRREFVVPDTNGIHRLLLRYRRDDGIVVYINGTEVVRENMPSGQIAPRTRAADVIEEGVDYHTADFIAPLRQGTNLIAAEVHQWSPESSDLLFDCELSTRLSRGPYLQAATATGVVVRWRTPGATDSCVRIGRVLGTWVQTLTPPGITNEHEVSIALTNRVPGERWYYAVGSTNHLLAWGEDCFFTIPPTDSQPVRIWVLGDSGTASAGLSLAESLFPILVRDAYRQFNRGRRTDVWLMLGDNAYGDGHDHEYQVAVFDLFTQELRQTVLWPTIGNHDSSAVDRPHVTDFPYLRIFSPPINGEAGGIPSGTRRYYSFDHANIHFVCLDAMTSDRTNTGPMCAWLRADLNANKKDWLIAFWHHPPYSKGTHDSDSADELMQMRQNVVPILEEFGADLVLCGHSHSYERSVLINGHYGLSSSLTPPMVKDAGSGRIGDTGPYRKGTTPGNRAGTVYVVAGCSGLVSPGQRTDGQQTDHPVMFTSLYQLGSLVIDVNASQLNAAFLSTNGVLDRFTIVKDDGPEALRLVGFNLQNGRVMARWKSQAGQRYRVERTTGFDRVGWQWVGTSEEIVASGATSTWSGVFPVGVDTVFYRVVALP